MSISVRQMTALLYSFLFKLLRSKYDQALRIHILTHMHARNMHPNYTHTIILVHVFTCSALKVLQSSLSG